jgi:hypothetical protein
VEHLKVVSLRWAPALPSNIRLDWKGLLVKNVLPMLKFVNYGFKEFHNIGPWTEK